VSLRGDNVIEKGAGIKDLIEPLLLFFVIFFAPASTGFPEVERSLFFRIPALALVFRFVPEPLRFFRPAGKDLRCFAVALPALAVTGLGVSFMAARSGVFPGMPVRPPESAAAWTAVLLASLTAGFLEEGYFRVYLLEHMNKAGMKAKEAAAAAVVLFSLCHWYEGLWGVVNAALAGIILSFLFLKSKSFYGIALAHGCYNIGVYAFTALYR
jgi:membrane protease YdiL (CAAX protease family)